MTLPRITLSRLLALGVGVGLVAVATLAPLRSSAYGAPTLLRPHRFAPVSVSVEQVASGLASVPWRTDAFDRSLFGEPGDWNQPRAIPFETAEGASQELHRRVRVPASLPDGVSSDPTIVMHTASSASYTLDLPKIYATLASAGIEDLQLPTSLHGATLVLNIPASVTLTWGSGSSALALTQMGQPTLSVPAEVDLGALHDLVLSDSRIAALEPDAVAQLLAIADWQDTIPVPIPAGMATSSVIRVGGGDALAVHEVRTGRTLLLWQRGGNLFALAGHFDADTLGAVASSIQ